MTKLKFTMLFALTVFVTGSFAKPVKAQMGPRNLGGYCYTCAQFFHPSFENSSPTEDNSQTSPSSSSSSSSSSFAERYYEAGQKLLGKAARRMVAVGQDRQAIEQLATAFRMFKASANSDPANSDAYVGMGVCQLGLGNRQGALANANRALAIDPNNELAYRLKQKSIRGR